VGESGAAEVVDRGERGPLGRDRLDRERHRDDVAAPAGKRLAISDLVRPGCESHQPAAGARGEPLERRIGDEPERDTDGLPALEPAGGQRRVRDADERRESIEHRLDLARPDGVVAPRGAGDDDGPRRQLARREARAVELGREGDRGEEQNECAHARLIAARERSRWQKMCKTSRRPEAPTRAIGIYLEALPSWAIRLEDVTDCFAHGVLYVGNGRNLQTATGNLPSPLVDPPAGCLSAGVPFDCT
jgi:hypothetical protein